MKASGGIPFRSSMARPPPDYHAYENVKSILKPMEKQFPWYPITKKSLSSSVTSSMRLKIVGWSWWHRSTDGLKVLGSLEMVKQVVESEGANKNAKWIPATSLPHTNLIIKWWFSKREHRINCKKWKELSGKFTVPSQKWCLRQSRRYATVASQFAKATEYYPRKAGMDCYRRRYPYDNKPSYGAENMEKTKNQNTGYHGI